MAIEIPDRIFGLTIDSIDEHNISYITGLLKEFRNQNEKMRPVVRIVFDPGTDAEKFNPQYDPKLIEQLKNETGIVLMGELLDSFDVHNCVKCSLPPAESVKSYRKRLDSFFEKLGGLVDIWEIGNEVNGEWTGWRGSSWESASVTVAEMKAVRETVAQQFAAALEDVRAAGKKTALTLYFNDDGAGKTSYANDRKKESPGSDNEIPYGADFSMLKWIEDYRELFRETDYVLISYYEDDNFYTAPDGSRAPIRSDENRWAEIFARLKNSFTERTKFGFGEVAPQCHYRQSDNDCRRVLDIYGSAADKRANNCTPPNAQYWEIRRCRCCLKAQKSYIERYYTDWDSKIRRTLSDRGIISAENYIGGYFYWYYNNDVINKLALADDEKTPLEHRKKLRDEAAATQKVLTDIYSNW